MATIWLSSSPDPLTPSDTRPDEVMWEMWTTTGPKHFPLWLIPLHTLHFEFKRIILKIPISTINLFCYCLLLYSGVHFWWVSEMTPDFIEFSWQQNCVLVAEISECINMIPDWRAGGSNSKNKSVSSIWPQSISAITQQHLGYSPDCSRRANR